MIRFILGLCLCLLWPHATLAGTLTRTGAPPIGFDTQLVDPAQVCTHRFTGQITRDDARKIIAARPSLLCLDSPGGSLVEALKLTAHMEDNPIATRLEAGASCASACALIFMGGTFRASESDGPMYWRVMHPTARLGFHAPSLNVGRGSYSEENVKKAYGIALQSVSRIIFDLIHREDATGSGLKVSLLGQMLQTPPDSMFYVTTVDQAGRWGITVGPLAFTRQLSKKDLFLACNNASNWQNDLAATGRQHSLPDIWQPNANHTGFRGFINGMVTEAAMIPMECSVSIGFTNGTPYGNLSFFDGGFYPVSPLVFFDPRMKLNDLKPRQASLSGGERVSCQVRKGNRVLDDKTCDKLTESRGNDRIFTFIWPSGAKTVLEATDRGLFLNGTATQRRSDGLKSCYLSLKTGNTFCHR